MCEQAAQAAQQAITVMYGNPSSLHGMGLEASQAIELARSRVAALLGCEANRLYFAPSGTAANNTAVFGVCERLRREGDTIITTAAEHPSVSQPIKKLEASGMHVIRIAPEKDGNINEDELLSAVTKNTVLVSVMAVNNETGAVFPVSRLSAALKRAGAPGLVHCDCVQALGKLKLSPRSLNADLITVSAHKIHGMKGAGALYAAAKNMVKPQLLGGGQEDGMFSGTQAVPALVAFGAAAQQADIERGYEHAAQLKRVLLGELEGANVTVISAQDALPHIVSLSLTGVMAQPAVTALYEKGFCVSAGSACKRGGRSETLAAMGIDARVADSAVRISFSRYNTVQDTLDLAQAIKEVIKERSK